MYNPNRAIGFVEKWAIRRHTGGSKTRLYAGTPENPAVLVCTKQAVTIRPVRTIRRKDPTCRRESSETIRQAPHGDEIVRTAWRHAEPGRNVLVAA